MASAGASRDRVWSGVAVGEGVGRGVAAAVGAEGEDLSEPQACAMIASAATSALTWNPPLGTIGRDHATGLALPLEAPFSSTAGFSVK